MILKQKACPVNLNSNEKKFKSQRIDKKWTHMLKCIYDFDLPVRCQCWSFA